MIPAINHYSEVLQPQFSSGLNWAPVPFSNETPERVFAYYQQTLEQDAQVQAYLKRLGISMELARQFQLGYADRTLGHQLPIGKSVEGGMIRGELQRQGLVKPSGHELFRGALVAPIQEKHQTVAAYGRRTARKINRGTDLEIIWSLDEEAPLFHQEGLSSLSTVILCQNPLDALVFMGTGHDRVVATLGLNGFSLTHLKQLQKTGVKAVSIVFENTIKGRRYAHLVAQCLASAGICCRQAILPEDSDLISYIISCSSVTKGLAELMLRTQPCSQSYETILDAQYV